LAPPNRDTGTDALNSTFAPALWDTDTLSTAEQLGRLVHRSLIAGLKEKFCNTVVENSCALSKSRKSWVTWKSSELSLSAQTTDRLAAYKITATLSHSEDDPPGNFDQNKKSETLKGLRTAEELEASNQDAMGFSTGDRVDLRGLRGEDGAMPKPSARELSDDDFDRDLQTALAKSRESANAAGFTFSSSHADEIEQKHIERDMAASGREARARELQNMYGDTEAGEGSSSAARAIQRRRTEDEDEDEEEDKDVYVPEPLVLG
jgi:hypothetical protein